MRRVEVFGGNQAHPVDSFGRDLLAATRPLSVLERVRFSVYETIWALVAVDWATWALRACIAAVIFVLFWAFGVAASWPDKAP